MKTLLKFSILFLAVGLAQASDVRKPVSASDVSSALACPSASGSATDYTCPTVVASTCSTGLQVLWTPDVTNAGGTTLNVGCGVKAVHNHENGAATAGLFTIHIPILLTYDGTEWLAPVIVPSAAGGAATGTITVGSTVLAGDVQYIPLANPQAVYLFTEGSGATVHDTSGHGYDCTISNSNRDITWLTGQGIKMAGTAQIVCPGAAFNNPGLIQMWILPGVFDKSSYLLYSQSSTADILYIPSRNTVQLADGGANTNQLVDRIDGNVSLSIVPSPFALYVNGKTAIGTVEAPVSFSFSATTTVDIGYYSACFVGNIYAIVVYPAGSYTAAQVAANDRWMWQRLSANGIRPRDDPAPSRSPQIYAGDSITAGQGVTGLLRSTSYPSVANQLLSADAGYYNLGQPSQTTTLFEANYVVYDTLLRMYPFGNPVVSVMMGVNDVTASVAASTIVYRLNEFCTNVHTSLPSAKCLISTITPETSWSGTQKTIRTTANSTIISQWLAGTLTGDGVVDVANDPIMGNALLASNTTWFADGTHPTAAGHALLAQRFAAAQSMATTRKPFWMQVQIPYQYFTTASSGATATVNLLQLGPGQQACGVRASVTTPFAGTGITILTASIGDSTGTATQYLAAQDVLTATNATAQAPNYVSVNGIVQAAFSATGGNLSALSAGMLKVYICTVAQP